ncbi:MAG: ABC transporter ATP-binding protein [Roseivirga sp.]|nr:ABC transporter ATP-binding protein [Roseivirga sp.]
MIRIEEISKSFGDNKAVDSISFEVNTGEIFGFLGPNGAGKSTTLNILSTLLKPDKGRIFINDQDLQEHKRACQLQIGVVPQEISLYADLSALDNVLFWGGLYGMPKARLKERAMQALEMVGLADRKKDSIKTYSGGMKRRINLACSILHDPSILLLDEPTVGVDIQSRNHIFEVIEKLRDDGMTIIYTTHYLDEVERLCDNIAIIDGGKIKAQGDLETLGKISKIKDVLTVQTDTLSEQVRNAIRDSLPSCSFSSPATIELECTNIADDTCRLMDVVRESGVRIQSIDTRKADLESIFLKLTGKNLRD